MIRRLIASSVLALALVAPGLDLRAHAAPALARCGKGGGGGGSTSSTSTSNETTTVQVDKRLVVDSGVGVSADSSNVNLYLETLDAGAVSGGLDVAKASTGAAFGFADAFGERGFDFARDVGEGGAKIVDRVLGIADKVFTNSFDTIGKTQEALQTASGNVATAYDAAKGAGSEKTLVTIAALAVVAVVAVKAWGK